MAHHRRYPPPMPYNPYLARNALGGRLGASRYRCRGANANESQQRAAAYYPKSIRFAGEMQQSLSLFRASTPPCLKKTPLHAPKEHYALAAIKVSELNRQASEKSGDDDSDVVIIEESENGDVDLRVMNTGVELGSGALQTRGNNDSEKVPPTRWDTCRSALAQASTNRKRGHEHLEEVYLSSDDEKAKASSQPTGWKGTYVRHPPKYAKNALRHKLEAQRPSRMMLLFERQNGLTDEALLEDANLHLQTMLESAHSSDPSVQKIHNEELHALKHALKVLQLRIDNNPSDRRMPIERLGLQWKKVLQSLEEWFENESRIRMDIEMQLLLRRLSDFFGSHPEICFSSDNRHNAQKPNAAGAGSADR
ncbi:hypothetical protein AAVH_16475 [Aphelenchoides avenae]|nr:hypothetical protein AAVH_16475 [Aphelenchus avenae]